MAAPPQPQIPTGTIPGQIGAQRPERIERGDHGERGDRGERFDRGNARPDPTPGVPRNSAVRPAPQIDHPAPRAPEAVRAAPPPVAPPAAQVQHPAPVQQPRAAEVPRPPAAPEARHPEAPPRARAEGARDDQREGRDRGRKEQ
jgi:hypothetical protein